MQDSSLKGAGLEVVEFDEAQLMGDSTDWPNEELAKEVFDNPEAVPKDASEEELLHGIKKQLDPEVAKELKTLEDALAFLRQLRDRRHEKERVFKQKREKTRAAQKRARRQRRGKR